MSINFITDMENRYFEYRQYKYGLLTEQELRARLAIAVGKHGVKRDHRWWSKVGRNLWPAEFVEFIDDVLRDEVPMDMYQQFIDWVEKS